MEGVNPTIRAMFDVHDKRISSIEKNMEDTNANIMLILDKPDRLHLDLL